MSSQQSPMPDAGAPPPEAQPSGRERWERCAWWAFLGFAVATWAARVSVAGGAPSALLWTASLLTLGAALLTIVARPRGCWLDWHRLVLVCAALIVFPSVYEGVGGDGYEYYALLRSAWFDHDLDVANDYAGLGARPVVTTTGQITTRFPMGTSLVWAPAVILTHGTCLILSALGVPAPTDGFAVAYRAAATTTTFVCGVLALLLIEGLVRRYFGATLALLTCLGLWFVTPLDFYLTVNPSMSQGVAVFACSLFVALWWRARDSGDGAHAWLIAGAAGGLMIVVRGQDGLLLLLAVADLLWRRRRAAFRSVLALATVPLVAATLQIGLWWHLYGSSLVQAVQYNGHIVERSPQFLDFLFAARHGVFTWTPLLAVAASGWLLWLRRDRRIALLSLAGFLAMVLVLSTEGAWWGDDSFGQRRILGYLPFFGLGLGAALDWLRRHPLVAPTLALLVGALWTEQFTYIYNADLVAGKNEAVSLDRLAAWQIEIGYRSLRDWEPYLPARIFALAYDNIKGVWLDEGPRSLGGEIDVGDEPRDLHGLMGPGWYEPQRDGDITCRLSKNLRSWIRVPLRSPVDRTLTIRLRRALPELPVVVSVLMNGQAVATSAPENGWSEVSAPVPASSQRPGFNDLELRYSTTARRGLPGYHGKDVAVAVDWVRLERTPPSR